MTPNNSNLRVSDDDREEYATRLRDAHADGRLSVDEFQQRIDALYDAKTFAEVGPLVADLPAAAEEVVHGPVPLSEPDRTRGDRVIRVLWTVWACVLCVDLLVWGFASIASARVVMFWPVWLVVPGGVLLAIDVARRRRSSRRVE